MGMSDHDTEGIAGTHGVAHFDLGEDSFVRRSPAGATQDAMRMVNAHHGLARDAAGHAHDSGSGGPDDSPGVSPEVDSSVPGGVGAGGGDEGPLDHDRGDGRLPRGVTGQRTQGRDRREGHEEGQGKGR